MKIKKLTLNNINDFKCLKTNINIIFGAGIAGKIAFELLEKYDIEVDYFGDNSELKCGDFIGKSKILSIEEIKILSLSNKINIIICMTKKEYISQVEKQITDMGISCIMFELFDQVNSLKGTNSVFINNNIEKKEWTNVLRTLSKEYEKDEDVLGIISQIEEFYKI